MSPKLLSPVAGLLVLASPALPASGQEGWLSKEPVGRLGANRHSTPVNQVLTPLGQQVELPGLRPQALALSPNGRLLVTAGKTHELVVIHPETGGILQRVPLPAESSTNLFTLQKRRTLF